MDAVFSNLQGENPQNLFQGVKTPCYILEECQLKKNGEILLGVQRRTGCKILLAQKAFSNYDCYPLLSQYLAGTEASGLYETRLGFEKMPEKEVHVFCSAYREDEIEEIFSYADHIVFNSPRQLQKFGKRAKDARLQVGLRINPECSTQEDHEIYNPCAQGSRLGTTREQWDQFMTEELIDLVDGLHFHTLCEQNADALEVTMQSVEEKFGDILPQMKWLNMGGGHHITKADYDISLLEKIITSTQEKWNLLVYLEPGEAVALNAGYLVTRVLDVVENNGIFTAILDTSAACHMPDVIEMPYLPPLYGTKKDGESVYRLGGPTCLSGDVVGEYAFEKPLREGDLLLFGDMAIYTTCKNNTFNGMPLPDILLRKEDGSLEKVACFGYEDFQMRLGRR